MSTEYLIALQDLAARAQTAEEHRHGLGVTSGYVSAFDDGKAVIGEALAAILSRFSPLAQSERDLATQTKGTP